MKTLLKFYGLLSLMLLCSNSYANAPAHCAVIHYQRDHIYTLLGAMHRATHVVLPVAMAASPVVGNSDSSASGEGLWHVEAQGRHIFFKPTNAKHPEGALTSMTVLGVNGQSYEFLLKRDKAATMCVHVLDEGALLNKSWQGQQKNAFNTAFYQANPEKTNAYDTLNAHSALEHYRAHIFGAYRYQGKAKALIASVYDDGRWTYIRLKRDPSQLMSLYGKNGHEKEQLAYEYDALNRLYRINGIYSQLYLKAGKQQVQIERLA